MEAPSPSSPPPPTPQPDVAGKSNTTVQIPPPSDTEPFDDKKPQKTLNFMKKRRPFKELIANPSSSSSSSSSASAFSSSRRCARVPFKLRNPKVVFSPVRRRHGGVDAGEVEAIAFPLGMSFAAVVAQILERKEVARERVSVDHLSMICTSAVRESLANVFGDKFDFFVRNFDKSFGSTLKTLRLINESSINKRAGHSRQLNRDISASDILNNTVSCTGSFGIEDSDADMDLPAIAIQNRIHISEVVGENVSTDCLNRELSLHGQINDLASAPSSLDFISTFEKSVMEQARSNYLKTIDIGIAIKKLKLKETQLALSSDSNYLEKFKLAMGISKASFKAEKFKSQLEDTRHVELLRKCMDCLVAGLFIMSASLLYGAYVFSYRRITEATESCTPSIEESNSWWIPRRVSTFNWGLHTLSCQVQVVSRMLFGILMILAVAYLLLQRSATSQHTMPVTFVLLLLGTACGFAGKLCVDTLGGNGLHWLLYWETLCALHFFSTVCISTMFRMLYGPIVVVQGVKQKAMCPYRYRQFLFYGGALVFLPLCCGLLPFASPGEWVDHFTLLATNLLSASDD